MAKIHRTRNVEAIHVKVEIRNGNEAPKIKEEIIKALQKLKHLYKVISYEVISEDHPE